MDSWYLCSQNVTVCVHEHTGITTPESRIHRISHPPQWTTVPRGRPRGSETYLVSCPGRATPRAAIRGASTCDVARVPLPVGRSGRRALDPGAVGRSGSRRSVVPTFLLLK